MQDPVQLGDYQIHVTQVPDYCSCLKWFLVFLITNMKVYVFQNNANMICRSLLPTCQLIFLHLTEINQLLEADCVSTLPTHFKKQILLMFQFQSVFKMQTLLLLTEYRSLVVYVYDFEVHTLGYLLTHFHCVYYKVNTRFKTRQTVSNMIYWLVKSFRNITKLFWMRGGSGDIISRAFSVCSHRFIQKSQKR